MLWERLWIAHSLPSLPRALRFHPIQNAETLWQTLLKACVLTLNRLVLGGVVICREVQLDLVEIISEMKCQRILSLIVAIVLFVCTIGFLVVRKFGAGAACFGLFLVEVLCWLFSYYYSRSLMLTISLSPQVWILTVVFYSPLCWLC